MTNLKEGILAHHGDRPAAMIEAVHRNAAQLGGSAQVDRVAKSSETSSMGYSTRLEPCQGRSLNWRAQCNFFDASTGLKKRWSAVKSHVRAQAYLRSAGAVRHCISFSTAIAAMVDVQLLRKLLYCTYVLS